MKPLQTLYFTQFISAFADNMILFITLAVIQNKQLPDMYIGVVQACFLVAFVVLAPFVGAFADKHSKSTVLLIGNAIKAAGIAMLLLGLDPAVSYAVVGVGAALYSPAKYGILPSLTQGEHELLRANARIEGYTIVAILLGSVAGGLLARWSLLGSMAVCLVFYLLSLALTLRIPRMAGNSSIRYGREMRRFFLDFARLLGDRATRFSLIGTGSFWMTSAVVRLAVLAWIPAHLGITSVDRISLLVAVIGVGIMLGAFLTPKLLPAGKYYNSLLFGLLLLITLLLFPLVSSLPLTVALLLVVGFCGGVFIVPMNTVLQEKGQRKVGAGKTIAIQNFVENLLMLLGVGGYTQIAAGGFPTDGSLIGIAVILALFVGYLALQRRRLLGLPV